MKNKKVLLVTRLVIIIVILGIGIYNYIVSHTFPEQHNAKKLIIEKVKEIENETERAEMIELLVQENFLTEKEANTLY